MPLFNPASVGQYFTVKYNNIILPAAQLTQLVAPNASRTLILFSVQSSQVVITPGIPNNGFVGFTVFSTSSPLILTFGDWGGIIGMDWYASNNAGGITVNTLEVLYNPPGD